jgi:hypothetical protein
MKKLALPAGLLLLFAAEIGKVYFIMPFPGSQRANTLDLAYFIHRNIWILRIAALLLILAGIIMRWPQFGKLKRGLLFILLGLYAVIFYFFNFKFLADKMFYQPRIRAFAGKATNKVSERQLAIAVTINGESKAYPIQIIGYHHQVQDTIGGEPVIVTYCTVCRTGRVYSPVLNGNKESFRLVGMDHFNAMFEDAATGSWWAQATGEAITGKRKGQQLTIIPSEQLRLDAFFILHPAGTVLQPDSNFSKQYKDLEGFDEGRIKGNLEKRDSGSWQFKSWVVGITHGKDAVAVDWNDLQREKLVQDSLPGIPFLLKLEYDSVSFHAWDRRVDGQTLDFNTLDSLTNWGGTVTLLKDRNTGSYWDMLGHCTHGVLEGKQLEYVPASQEFWHAWQQFHPGTRQYLKPKNK